MIRKTEKRKGEGRMARSYQRWGLKKVGREKEKECMRWNSLKGLNRLQSKKKGRSSDGHARSLSNGSI